MALLTESDYDAIRHLLGSDFTDEDVPVSVIESDPYLPAAEAEIARILPDDTSDNARLAVMYLTAAYLSPLYPVPESAQLDDFRYTIGKNASLLLYNSLIARFRAAVAAAEEDAGTSVGPIPMMRVYRQRRYRSATSG